MIGFFLADVKLCGPIMPSFHIKSWRVAFTDFGSGCCGSSFCSGSVSIPFVHVIDVGQVVGSASRYLEWECTAYVWSSDADNVAVSTEVCTESPRQRY